MWCNRYRPGSYAELSNDQTTAILSNLARQTNPPHLLFIGPSGSGRHTRAYLYLQQLFGSQGPLVFSSTTMTYQHNDQSFEIPVVSTHYSLEINPSFAQHDASVVSSIIKDAAQTAAVNGKFKVLLLQEADKLSFLAQQALRRLMEEYQRTCKLILFATSQSGLIPPIRSRCFSLNFRGFTNDEMCAVLENLEKLHNFSVTDKNEFVENCGGDMRRLYLQAQAECACQQRNLQGKLKPKWERLADSLLSDYVFSQKNIDVQFRTQLVEILKLAVPPETLLHYLFQCIERKSSNCKLKAFNALMAAEYGCRLQQSQISLVHLEAYLLNIMSGLQSCR